MFRDKKKQKGRGNSHDKLIRKYFFEHLNNENSYIYKMFEDMSKDMKRKTQDQVGIMVSLGLSDLLKHSVQNPRLSCDGTFNKVTDELNDDMS